MRLYPPPDLSRVYQARVCGLRLDGSDETTALNALLQVIHDGGGGVLQLPPGTLRCDGQVVLPNDGQSVPTQPSLRVVGAGAHFDGRASGPPDTGTVLDLRYAVGRDFADAATTSGSPTLTSATAAFTASDVGKYIAGGGIPAGTTISARVNATTITLSANATATATGVTARIVAPKILTLGLGLLDVHGVSFYDGGTSNTPFLRSTNTTLHLHGCSFWGAHAGALATQDAIVLGGSTNTIGGTADCAFQGYGAVVERCYFGQIRRAVYGQTYANGVVIRDNAVWSNCGGTAAIDIAGVSTSERNTGNLLAGNLIECTHYTYAVQLANASGNTLVGNNYYDPGAGLTAFVSFGANAEYNTVLHGYHDDTKADIAETTAGSNTVLTGHQSRVTTFAQPTRFLDTTAPLKVKRLASGAMVGPLREDSSGDVWDESLTYNSGTGFASWIFRFLASGGSAEQLLDIQRASSTESRLRLLGSSQGRIQQPNGDLRVESKAGNTLWLGDSSNNATITNGVLSATKGLTAGKQALTYSASITPAPASGAYMTLAVTDGNALTINAPSTSTNGQHITFEILNSSGGAMGAITWNATYKLAGSFTNPANGTRRTVSFAYNGSNWVEQHRAAADIS